MYFGPFYFQKRDFYILIAIFLLAGVIFLSLPLPLFDRYHLLVLAILFLFVTAGLPPIHDVPVFLTFFTAVILTLFLPLFQVVLFLALTLLLLKTLKAY